MSKVAYRRRARKCAGASVAIAALMALGGCSSSTSRFDFPSFGLAGANQSDNMATASVTPVPSEPVYGDGRGPQGGSDVASRPLPPIGSQPEPFPSYAQAAPAARLQPAAYVPQAQSPRKAYAAAEAEANAPQSRKYSGSHRVGGGDTLYGIARRHGISHKELAAANGIEPTASLRIGQVLNVPGGKSMNAPARVQRAVAKNDGGAPAVRVVKTVAIDPPAGDAKPVRVASVGPAPMPAANPQRNDNVVLARAEPSEAAVEEPRKIQRNASLPEPEPMTGNSFRWPVKGRIISEFGTKPNGSHNDGINVAVPEGTSVKAAENGVVAYAGSELKGYGNLILVRHANNWVSAYAHNDDILVKRGDKIRRGQIIAKAGKTGSVSQPQVHFELRKGSRPVDPTKYMKDT